MADFQTSTQRAKWIFTPQKLAERYKAANQRAVQMLEKCGTTQVEVDASGSLTYPTDKVDAGDQADKKLKPLSVDEERFMRAFYEAKVQEVCSAFEFPHKIQATALQYFKRFYLQWSVMQHHPKEIMLTCVYAACKIEENHVSATLQAIFCVPQTLNTLLSFLAEIPSIRLVVVVGGADEHLPSLPSGSGVKIVSYQKLLSQGRSSLHPFSPPKPEDIATICYTSGTTGTPKGAMLTHENLIANVAGFSAEIIFLPHDIYISYLPLAHIYERANQIMAVYGRVAVGFYQGDILKLMDDLAVLRPTIFCSVPRLYNRIYDGVTSALKSSGVMKKRLFQVAYNSKKQAIINGICLLIETVTSESSIRLLKSILHYGGGTCMCGGTWVRVV